MAAHLHLLCYVNKDAIDESLRGEASECCSMSSRDGHVASCMSKSEHSSTQNVRL
jgi:hypothetical protein